MVRSDYKPALAEFAVLRPSETRPRSVTLEMHPHEEPPTRFGIPDFLVRNDFVWLNQGTGRSNTYGFGTVKTQAIAAARKAITMGPTAIFAANKRGREGAIGLAWELLRQLERRLPLLEPAQFCDQSLVDVAAEYLQHEYGAEWVGTQALRAGAVLHHGDIPQETREVVEDLVRKKSVRLVICTSTLAEGVNLPIRTLVLYSVQRLARNGRRESLKARDIKNLVGRAGRAGATTKGLVICANSGEWPYVERVARHMRGETVEGALRRLLRNLRRVLAERGLTLNNQVLEGNVGLHALTDGIDATLVDLAAEEIGEEELVRIAVGVADHTFAARRAGRDGEITEVLREVFALRARRIAGIRAAGRLDWLRDTGARARLLDSVERDLLPRREEWEAVVDPMDAGVVDAMLDWAWTLAELRSAVEGFRGWTDDGVEDIGLGFRELVRSWLAGDPFVEMAAKTGLSMDNVLGIHSHAIAFVLQTLVEQGVALLGRLLNAEGKRLAEAVTELPDHLRFGVPTTMGRILSLGGVRHRRAAVALGGRIGDGMAVAGRLAVFRTAREMLRRDRAGWLASLGSLVFDNALEDLGG